jgi:CheY-like chemotaxis protein
MHPVAEVRGNEALTAERQRIEQMLSTVRHELRTPLTSIRGSLGLLASGALGVLSVDAVEVVAIAERNAVRLIAFINDALESDDASALRPVGPMKVLIIDDDPDIRSIARLALSRVGGMDVIEASDGADGMRKAREEHPDVVLLDMMMPIMDGLETLAQLRAQPSTATTPVIFLTAKTVGAELERMTALGAAGVLTKPFDPRALSEAVRALVDRPVNS